MTDPLNQGDGTGYVALRGGSYRDSSEDIRSASRFFIGSTIQSDDNIGFRLVARGIATPNLQNASPSAAETPTPTTAILPPSVAEAPKPPTETGT